MPPEPSFSPSEELTDADFQKISKLVYDLCGINLHSGKKELVRARLGKRIRVGGFHSFRQYYQYVLEDQTGQELVHMLDCLSTNFTSFFREQKHFEYLKTQLLPELTERKRGLRKLRFWSAGCSSGEEPYSIAITLLEDLENPAGWNIKILATDLSSKVLQAASSGIYESARVASIPPQIIRKYFLKGERRWENYVKVRDEVKRIVEFKRLNLMEPFYFSEPFHCIFCRNVMIYFDKKTQAALVNRFYETLAPGGILFIGHSEGLSGIEHRLRYLTPAVYRKAA
jgi:chemotaxis protein methyltransferase CheR